MTDDTAAGAAPEQVTPTAVLVTLPDGQAALFDDPRRLLTLDVADLRLLGVEVARESGSVLARVRRTNGLIAWAMWYQSTELAYADWERSHAEEIQQAPSTLRRWRRDVVAANDLPIPALAAVRSEAAKASAPGRKRAGQGPSATNPGSPSDTQARPIAGPGIPPGATVVLQPDGSGAVTAPLPNPGPPPTLRANIAHLIDHLHALDPDEAGAAMTPGELDIAMGWMETAAKAAPRPSTRAKKAKPPAARGDACPHPITRRIGSGCGACGMDPVTK